MNTKRLLILTGLAGLALMSPEPAYAAAQTIGEMAEKAEENIKSIKQLSLSVFYMIGLFLFGVGLFLLYKDQKTPNQGHAKNGFISIVIGVCLLLIPELIGIFSTSIGADASDSQKALESSVGFGAG